jgi:hypothetical protein
MGFNSGKYDKEADFNKKSLQELIKFRDKLQQGLDNMTEIGKFAEPFYRENLGYVKMKIAERIGRKR